MTMLLRVSDQRQKRIFTMIGAGFVAIALVAALLYVMVINPSGKQAKDTMAVVIETPFVGQGVGAGTNILDATWLALADGYEFALTPVERIAPNALSPTQAR